jgi:hypothetical protein
MTDSERLDIIAEQNRQILTLLTRTGRFAICSIFFSRISRLPKRQQARKC